MRSASSLPCLVRRRREKKKKKKVCCSSQDQKKATEDGREKLRCKYVCMYMKECESEETDCILCWGVGGGENGNTE